MEADNFHLKFRGMCTYLSQQSERQSPCNLMYAGGTQQWKA